MSIPEFDQFVEYVTEGPVVHPVALQQHSLESLPALEALQVGYAHADALGRAPTLDAAALTAVQTTAGAVYHADVVSAEVVSSDPAQIVTRLVWVADHPDWYYGAVFEAGAVVLYAGNLYRCVQSHTVTDPGWTPAATPALWARYYAPAEIPAWVQPVGASDAWPLGQQVSHAGHLWTSLVPANVWEPGAAGTEALWRCDDCEPVTEAWTYPHHYIGDNTAGAGNGDVVTYNGRRFRCRQTHDSISTWTPPATPSLWLDLGVI